MKKYSVLIEGGNFLINIEGSALKCGFFTTRFVVAETNSAEKKKAIELVKLELKDTVLNDVSDVPIMYVEKVIEVESFAGFSVPGSGFTWFQED